MKKTKKSIDSIRSAAKPAAAMIGGAVAIFFVGFFQFLAEASKDIKPFLTVHSGIGPLSGKVLYGYALGLVAYFLAYHFLKNKRNIDISRYFYAFVIILIIASLLVFVPFTDLLLGKA